MMIIGYARVSTEDQSLDLQMVALEEAGCDRVYKDHGVSGGQRSRPGLDRALSVLKRGDKLVVWRLDRLGRSLVHLVSVMERLGKKGVKFHSISECIDTSSPGGRLIFHVMAALAEFERTLISERTRAGIAAARELGRVIGRPPSLTREQVEAAHGMIKEKSRDICEVASLYGVHPRTLKRMLGRVQNLP
ncbi:recombinase family protein [Pseudomonas aeruginosa]|uniref:recombinase family protein n=2 Tax=Pseudomonas aeruginosa TaxID=287 RepID=UPI00336527E0